MFRLRSVFFFGLRNRNVFGHLKYNTNQSKRFFHYEEPSKPFDNLPMKVKSRYTLTVSFALLYGLALWTPFFIVWYAMAKRTM